MDQIFQQTYLDFGIKEHFFLIHGGHNDHVAVCAKNPKYPVKHKEHWQQKVYAHGQALYAEMELVSNHDIDVYQSQAGFNQGRRGVDFVSSLTSFWVDLDVYNIDELKNIDADKLLDLVRDKFSWLPIPTAIIDSGRGYYFQWFFKLIHRDKLARWQQTMEVLTDLLKPFGADPHSKDAARVLRVVDSVNTKNGEKVSGYKQTGEFVSFNKFTGLVLKQGLECLVDERIPDKEHTETPRHVASDKERSEIPRKRYVATDKQKAQGLRMYQLALDRMSDCHTLATLRGSPFMDDYRARLLYVYAVSGAYYWFSMAQARQEIMIFADTHFKDSNKYSHKIVGTVLNRMIEQRSGVAHIWNGQQTDRRYQLRNVTIIDNLDITLEEQEHMQTFITKQEKERRRVQRRREQGVKPRAEYTEQADKRREHARELSGRYWSQLDIAQELGCTRKEVSRLLATACG